MKKPRNARGEADGYMSKFWGLFLMPTISTAMALLLLAIPKIDPLKENVKKFRKYFDTFIILFLLFLFYLYLLTIFWNRGARFNFIFTIVPPFAVLFYYLRVLMGHIEKNWFIGIRTPWTMSSEKLVLAYRVCVILTPMTIGGRIPTSTVTKTGFFVRRNVGRRMTSW